ncbi:MAG: hypothetical protein GY804_12450 [Alphaproteobacteria bacterium]|nr:hypothetical protein [Alphaproteobacteria bacterium]
MKKFKWFIILAFVFLMQFSSNSYAASECTHMSETKEFYFRALYTNFMVSSDKCGTAGEYNKFIKNHKGAILNNVDALKKYHKRVYGKDWKKHLDAFMTKVANEISVGSNGDEYYKFCYYSWKMIHVMNNISDGDDMDLYIHKYAGQYTKHLPDQCYGEQDFWVKDGDGLGKIEKVAQNKKTNK